MSAVRVPPRSRVWLAAAALLTVALGLGSRAHGLPGFVTAYIGDALYAVLMYWIVAWCRPSTRAVVVAVVAGGICFIVEASQSVHPSWLDALRAHPLVALVLGRGFLWSDLGCYVVGVVLAAGVDVSWRRGSAR